MEEVIGKDTLVVDEQSAAVQLQEKTNTLRETLKAALGEFAPTDLITMVQAVNQEKELEAVTASLPVTLPSFGDAAFQTLKTHLTDKKGMQDLSSVFLVCRAALEANDQPGFLRGLFQLYKTVRLALPHLER